MEGGTDDDKSLKEIVSNCSYREEKVKENGPIVCAALVCVLEKEKHVLYRQNCKNENSNTQKDCQGYGKNVAKKALGKGDWKCKCAKSKVNQGKDIDLSALGLPSKYYPSWYSFAAHLRVSQLLLIVALLVPLAIVHVMTTTLFNGH